MHHLQQVFLLSSLLLVLILISAAMAATVAAAAAAIAKQGCQDSCGNISVPYPFGIGSKKCYLDESFKVACNHSANPPLLHYSTINGPEILQLTLEYARMLNWAPQNCYNKSTGQSEILSPGSLIYASLTPPFTYSTTRNKFTAVGCDIFACIPSSNFSSQNNYITGCASFCNTNKTVQKHNKIISCFGGNGCCQTSIPKGIKYLSVSISSINTNERSWEINPCSHGFIVENDYYKGFDRLLQSTDEFDPLLQSTDVSYVPVIMDWAIENKTCREVQRKNFSSSNVCGLNSYCVDSENSPGYKCRCHQGYHGNPYLLHGCQDTDECQGSNRSVCPMNTHCMNTLGDYTCVCPPGYDGYATKLESRCKHIKIKLPVGVVILIGIGAGIMVVLLLVVSFWLYRRHQARKKIILKQHYFKKNGGLLLKQKISTHDSDMEKDKIFAIEELEKATDNFNQSRVIGKGGFGTVYKGMLSDGRTVAIKKSTLVDESQVDQFINEVAILSQIIHRHAVKLLGCCLETHVPLLVYEYVSNGTLSQHLHSEGYVSSISWNDRLRIAAEIARALAYMHSEASIPIFHRDIKSSNILLDETYRAKVSDFGLSRSVPIEQTHLTTVVQGTFGYLDPEYFHSGQFTDKSDVYSFGVVLVELLTGERVVSLVRSDEETSLAMYFISALKQNRLFEIIEARVVTEGDKDELMIVAKIAKSCLKLNGKKRPLMKEVAASLERLRKFQEEPWVEPNKLQKDDFLVGETSSCFTTILEVDDYDDSNSLLMFT